ncbi:MAG TPA: hypothetical protein VGO47_14655 [Chlamydiales bacterium]|jgi:hypothetical protein|nr:hypothetical protein [Chlamydiales bacterium]
MNYDPWSRLTTISKFFSSVRHIFTFPFLVCILYFNLLLTYKLSEIRFNADGAFVGNIVNSTPNALESLYIVPDPKTMEYETFLATKLLDFTDRHEIRFTDNEGIGRLPEEHDTMDDALAAFTHSVLVDSDHTVIVTDIQGKQLYIF